MKHLTEEHKKNIRNALKGRRLSPNTQFKEGHKVPKDWKDKWRLKNKWQRGKERYNYKGITYHKGRRFITIGGKRIRYSHYVWCNQPLNLPYIPEGFVVHHTDGDTLNDTPDNLVLLPRNMHLQLHNPLQYRWKS